MTSLCVLTPVTTQYFLRMLFKFHLKACDGCHEMSQKSMSFKNAANVIVGRMIIECIFG